MARRRAQELDLRRTICGDHRHRGAVVVTVPREDRGEPLVPYALPPQVLACWSADQVIMSATAAAEWPSGAVEAVEALIPELAGALGATAWGQA
jgi:hypothetical protein